MGVQSKAPSEGASTDVVDAGKVDAGKTETAPHQKTQAEIDAEKKAAEDKAKIESDERAKAEQETDNKLAEAGADSDQDKDEDADSHRKTDTDTQTAPTTPEKATDPNANLFSKKRWAAVALDMAKMMVINSKHQDDSFLAGFGDKMRLIGIRVICWFVGKSWYNELSEDYKQTLNQKFGIKPKGGDEIFEFGEPAGGETSTTLESYLKSEDVLKAQFGDEKAFDNIEGLKVMKKDGLTFKQFTDGIAEVTDPKLKEKCEKLQKAMLDEKPAPDDKEKLVDFMGRHSDGIAKSLNLTGTIYTDKNNESLKDKVGKTEDLSGTDAKFEFNKILNTDNILSTHAVAITKDTLTVDGVDYKITEPSGAKIKSVSAVAGATPGELSTVKIVIESGTNSYTIDNFLSKLPDSAGLPYDLDSSTKLKFEVPKPGEEAKAEEPAPAPVEGSATPYETALNTAFASKQGQTSPLEGGGSFSFDLPYLDDKGVLNATPAKCTLSASQLKIDGTAYNIEIPVTLLPNKSFTSVKVNGDSIEMEDSDYPSLNKAKYNIKIKDFADMLDKLRKGTSSQRFTVKNDKGVDQIIDFKQAA